MTITGKKEIQSRSYSCENMIWNNESFFHKYFLPVISVNELRKRWLHCVSMTHKNEHHDHKNNLKQATMSGKMKKTNKLTANNMQY